MTICQRCGTSSFGSTMSMFNTQLICLACSKEERERPDFEEARRAESEAVARGDMNFPGISLKGGTR
jgi:hypothetical protein